LDLSALDALNLVAAYALGYRVRQAPNTPNAFINLGEGAIAFDPQRGAA
jgi:hypothetical protein